MSTTPRLAPFDVDPATSSRPDGFGQPVGEPLERPVAARAPEGVGMQGRSCRLEPLTVAHSADLFGAVRASGGDEQWTYLPSEPWRSVAQVEAELDDHVGRPDLVPYAVVAGDHACGRASLMRISLDAGTVEVGHVMFGAGARRATPATEALYLLARHVFDDLGFRRFEWKCDALNAPSRAAATRFGFTFEGVWRQAGHYKGRNRDTAWFAVTDADWALLRPAYEAWLDAALAPLPGAGAPRLSDLTAAALSG